MFVFPTFKTLSRIAVKTDDPLFSIGKGFGVRHFLAAIAFLRPLVSLQRNSNSVFAEPVTYARWTASYPSASSSDAILRGGRPHAALHGRPADLFALMTWHLRLTGDFRLCRLGDSAHDLPTRVWPPCL